RVDVHPAGCAGRPVPAGPGIVVRQRNRDAVGPDLVLQLRHVVGVQVDAALVLDLVQDDRSGAVGELVAGQDRVDVGEPLLGRGQVVRRAGPGPAGDRGQPAGKAARVGLRVDVRAGPGDHVDADLLRDVQQLVHVAHAGEVIDTGCGGV